MYAPRPRLQGTRIIRPQAVADHTRTSSVLLFSLEARVQVRISSSKGPCGKGRARPAHFAASVRAPRPLGPGPGSSGNRGRAPGPHPSRGSPHAGLACKPERARNPDPPAATCPSDWRDSPRQTCASAPPGREHAGADRFGPQSPTAGSSVAAHRRSRPHTADLADRIILCHAQSIRSEGFHFEQCDKHRRAQFPRRKQSHHETLPLLPPLHRTTHSSSHGARRGRSGRSASEPPPPHRRERRHKYGPNHELSTQGPARLGRQLRPFSTASHPVPPAAARQGRARPPRTSRPFWPRRPRPLTRG